jgi:hypothetical protein
VLLEGGLSLASKLACVLLFAVEQETQDNNTEHDTKIAKNDFMLNSYLFSQSLVLSLL